MMFLIAYLLVGAACGVYVHGATYGYFSRRFASLGYASQMSDFNFGISMGTLSVFAWPCVLLGMWVSCVGFGTEYGLRFAPTLSSPQKPKGNSP